MATGSVVVVVVVVVGAVVACPAPVVEVLVATVVLDGRDVALGASVEVGPSAEAGPDVIEGTIRPQTMTSPTRNVGSLLIFGPS